MAAWYKPKGIPTWIHFHTNDSLQWDWTGFSPEQEIHTKWEQKSPQLICQFGSQNQERVTAFPLDKGIT